MNRFSIFLAFFLSACLNSPARADLIPIANHSFEDTTGQSTFNEFTFGTPAGWSLYDPNGITSSAGIFPGTLMPNGVEFFNSLAPDGDRVAILFNSSREGDGEYGFEQSLSLSLTAFTSYSLSVEVGNIASGFATNGQFFNLDEFPGYRVELLAGGTVIASDANSLNIPEGVYATSTVNFVTGATHVHLGETLSIRLVNENLIPSGFTQATSPDLEVDFDNVRLDVTAVPEPTSIWLFACSFGLMFSRRKRQTGG
ncbi:MAG: PEP-CTERM sorting domain-containing protein [Pirellulaceae bacterium]